MTEGGGPPDDRAGSDDEGAPSSGDRSIETPSDRLGHSEPRRFPGWLLVVLGGTVGGFVGGWWGLAFGAVVGLLVWQSRAS